MAFYDQHYPYTIPAFHDVAHPTKETPILKFLRDFDPHVVIHGGDQLDLDCIAHWNRGKPRLTQGKKLTTVYDDYNRVLDRIERATPHADKVAFLEGNHERWIEDLLDEVPQFEDMIEIKKNLHLQERGYQWIEQRKHFKIGHLYAIHGDYKKGYLPAYHAKALAGIYGKSMIYGHVHYNQVYSGVTPFDQLPYQVQSVGCLCGLNPSWRRNEASAWVNAFYVAFILPNGNFHGYTVNIVNNQFVFDGKVYK